MLKSHVKTWVLLAIIAVSAFFLVMGVVEQSVNAVATKVIGG